MDDLYSVPADADLADPDTEAALAAVGIVARHYLANGVLNHVFLSRTGLRLHVVENERRTSKHLTEVVGDTRLWWTVRMVAADMAAAPALRTYISTPVRRAA